MLLLAKTSLAQDFSGEHIKSFNSVVKVNQDGTIDVAEEIVYDFADLQRHGIYREIPFTKTNKEGKRFKLEFKNISATDQKENKYKYSKIWNNSNRTLRLKIGDPNKTITGEHTYLVKYKVLGALTYFSDHDEIYWNITGNEWTVPIARVSSKIELPEAVESDGVRLACYTGGIGSTLSDCTSSFEDKTAVFAATKSFQSGEGLTIVLGLPKNTVSVLEPKPYLSFWERWYGKLLAGIIFVLVGSLVVFWYIIYPIWIVIKWILYGRDPRVPYGPVTAWYDPPKAQNGRVLTPAEVGTLIDETAYRREISAMIVDLARRGYLKIEEKKKNDFYFHKKTPKKPDQLMSFEKEFLFDVFKDGEISVRVKDLKLAQTVMNIVKQLYSGLVTEKFFPKNPQNIRGFYYVMGVLALFTVNIHTALIAFIFGHLMPRKTTFGAQAAQMAKSLKNFLTSQERQLEFQAKKQLMFEKLLPYAVAFGVEEIWAERFKDLGIKSPEWYSSYDRSSFNSAIFTRSLNSSFAAVARASTPISSSSGFSSGLSGASSGGGGGGGGGGSW